MLHVTAAAAAAERFDSAHKIKAWILRKFTKIMCIINEWRLRFASLSLRLSLSLCLSLLLSVFIFLIQNLK